MAVRVPVGRIRKLLSLEIIRAIAAFDEKHVESVSGRFECAHDAGGPAADNGEVSFKLAARGQQGGGDNQFVASLLVRWLGLSSDLIICRKMSRSRSEADKDVSYALTAFPIREDRVVLKSTTPDPFSRKAARQRNDAATSGSPQSAPIVSRQRERTDSSALR